LGIARAESVGVHTATFVVLKVLPAFARLREKLESLGLATDSDAFRSAVQVILQHHVKVLPVEAIAHDVDAYVS